MSRLTNHATRAGVSAVGVAVGLMVLASTSQTPDGFTRASFDGPLDIFGNSAPETQGDVLAIGNGAGDASDLAAILNGPLSAGSPNSPFQEAFAAGVGPNSLEVNAIPPAVAASVISDRGWGPRRANSGSSWLRTRTLTESIWMSPIRSMARRRCRR